MEVVTLMQLLHSLRFHKLTRSIMVLALVLAFAFSTLAQQVRTGASVRVTTRDEADKAVAAVVVELKRNGATVIKTTTSEKGEAEFTDVAPGSYEVVISKAGLETLNQTD